MRFSIASRIFLGFLIVLLGFSGVMGFTFYRMQRIKRDLTLVNEIYIELTIKLADLSIRQTNLVSGGWLDAVIELSEKRRATDFYQYRALVEPFLPYRVSEIRKALKLIRDNQWLSTSKQDKQFMSRIENQLVALESALSKTEGPYDQLFARKVPARSLLAEDKKELRDRERDIIKTMTVLRDQLRKKVKEAALQVGETEDATVWAILALTVLAALVSITVALGAQLMLRPLKQLVAGTKRIGSGEYGHRVIVTSRDELGLLGREFNSMASAIEEREQRLIRSERMAAAGQIASHITHEIRNPLSSISLNTELLEDELQMLEPAQLSEARKLCQAMRHEVDRLTEITEEYLRFARLPKPHLEPEDLNEILQNLLAFMASELRERRVEVIQKFEKDLPLVDADENQLRQALLNLLRNAGEAMMDRGGSIHVSTRLCDSTIEVEIADTGIGIESKDLPKVFEPFFSTKESGTGLGLALTQQIIQEHGGVIVVDSTPGQGTIFKVRLPACTAREKA